MLEVLSNIAMSYLPMSEHCGASVHTAALSNKWSLDGEGGRWYTGSGGSVFLRALSALPMKYPASAAITTIIARPDATIFVRNL